MVEELTALDSLRAEVEVCAANARELAGAFDLEADEHGAHLQLATSSLQKVATRVEELLAVVADLRDRAERATAAWHERTRFTPAGVDAAVAQISELAARRPQQATARLLAEVAAALAFLELAAAAHLASSVPDAPLPSGTADGLAAWAKGELGPALDAVNKLRSWARDQRVAPDVISQLDLVAAWLSYNQGDAPSARALLEQRVNGAPRDSRARVDLAGFLLLVGDGDMSASEAQRAIDLDLDNGLAYLQAGATAEAGADYSQASPLYAEGCARLDRVRTGRVGRGVTFLQPTGLLQIARAERLAELGDVAEALAALDTALASGVAGEDPYPEAEAYEVRCKLLQRVESPPLLEVAHAALEAGKRHLWNHRLDRAITHLRLAAQAGADIPEAGWFLANALNARAVDAVGQPQGPSLPDAAFARQARDTWDEWRDRIGPPEPSCSWAYALRAYIADNLAVAEARELGPMSWEALVLCERALVLNRFDSLAWAASAQYLRVLHLEVLALDSVERGFAANPDEPAVLRERVALLANAGRFEETLETLKRIPEGESDPWLMGIRAWTMLHLGKPAEALPHLEVPLASSWDLGWYFDLRASCFIRLGRLDEAVADLRQMLEADVMSSGERWLRSARAHAALGEPDVAAKDLAKVRQDETVEDDSLFIVEACIALATGDTKVALTSFQRSVDASRSRRSAEDGLWIVRELIALLAHGGLPVPEPDAVLRQAEVVLSGWQGDIDAASPDPADAELARIIAEKADDLPGHAAVALAAIRARRLRYADQLGDAEVAYGELRGGTFEPEATVALAEVVTALLEAAIGAGDVALTKAKFARLAELGRSAGAFLEVAVADAHRAAGRTDDAVAALLEVAPLAKDPADQLAVYERLGECALALGDHALAETSFSTALAAATTLGQPTRAAQLHVRLAVAWAMGGATQAAADHLVKAQERWREAGAFDPSSILEREVSWLVDAFIRPDQPALTAALAEATRRTAAGDGDGTSS